MNLDTIRSHLRAAMPDVLADLRAKAHEHKADAPRREAGYTIQNATGNEAVVRIYDEIWWLGVNALDLAADLDGITAPEIRVEINSPGGDVFDGIAIYNALRTHPAKVTTRVDGIAASIASVIAQAGDHRIMVQSSQMMIHNAWGMTVGNRNDHNDMADVLAQQDEIIAGIYASRSGKPAEGFRALMDAESWLSDERALAEGLADEIFVPGEQPQDKAPTLSDTITSLASQADEALSGVERLVAGHDDAGAALTAAKREGLVALQALGVRAADLLTPIEDEADEPSVDITDIEMARLRARQRDAAFRADLAGHLPA